MSFWKGCRLEPEDSAKSALFRVGRHFAPAVALAASCADVRRAAGAGASGSKPRNASSRFLGWFLKELHEDPAVPENLILFYTGRSQDKDLNASGNNAPDRWNREHTWPRSHGVGDDRGRLAHNDLHHLMPTDKEVNAHRASLDFDEGGSPEGEAPDTFFDSESFEPRDEVKGAVARAVFYMATRYEGSDSERDLELVDASGTNGSAGQLGDLCTLLEWHEASPPDEDERQRNDTIFTDYQANRNPFVDRPEFATAVWGSQC